MTAKTVLGIVGAGVCSTFRLFPLVAEHQLS
jgi:hypothetical protein